jgi:sigma-B regulation protein RsbU (phosphoserine phosphatase)
VRYETVDISNIPEAVELNALFREASVIDQPSLMLQHFGKWFGRRRPTDLFVSVARRDLPPGRFKITRLMTRAERLRAGEREPPNPWRDWESLPVLEGGLIGEIIAQERPQILRAIDAADDPHLGASLAGIRSAVAIPQYHEGRATNWALSFFNDPIGLPDADLPTAVIDTSLLGMATRNLVSKRQADMLNRELTHQFEQIANIQRSLLPQRLPTIPGLEIATSYLTSDRAGGDYYDFFPFPDGSWGILIADVSGHGPAAATVMAMLRAILHCYAGEDLAPSSVMRYTNDKLVASNLDGSFVTALFAVYDPASSVLAWSRCGHPPPALKGPGTEGVRELRESGVPPLGIMHGLEPDQESLVIAPGETVVLYTDGITEAFSPDGVMFGVRGLVVALERCSGRPECVVDSVHSALYQHTGVMDRDDDQTLVALQRIGPA